jgi:hypothetical protein
LAGSHPQHPKHTDCIALRHHVYEVTALKQFSNPTRMHPMQRAREPRQSKLLHEVDLTYEGTLMMRIDAAL